MVTTPSVDTEAFQPLDEIRERLDYEGEDFFADNEQLRFDQLLVRLERESRGIFLTLYGDQTPLEETGRTDVKRTTDDAAIMLVYPINDIAEVEYKPAPSSDWEVLDSDRWDFTDHRLVLVSRRRTGPPTRGNELTDTALRTTWRDLASKIRVTYDRGYGPETPGDIKSVQIQMINQFLRKRKREQTTAAATPDELAGMSETSEVVTEEIRQRVSDVTSPGGATMSI